MATANPDAVVLNSDERFLVVKGLNMLAASFRRSSKAAPSAELRDIYDRDAARLDALAVKFR